MMLVMCRPANPPRWPFRRPGLLALLGIAALQLALAGCATWQAPEGVDDAVLRMRAVSETVRDVRLSAAVLGTADSERLFGFDVNAAGIQPLWVEVENRTPETLWLLRAGTDPDYFSPLEVAWSFHITMGGARNAAIDEHFDALDFSNPIPPRSTRAGVIFTNPHYRTRVLNLDLLGRATLRAFTLFLPDPDNPPDEDALQTVMRHFNAARVDIDEPGVLRDALESAPCCAETSGDPDLGEPVNMALVGRLEDIAAALVRRGFRSDRKDFDDAQRVFGRRPDLVLRKAGQGRVSAHWIRAWVAPFRYRGQPVFLAQAGRATGGRFAVGDGAQPALHPDADEVRNVLIEDLLYSGGVSALGFAYGAGAGVPAQPEEGASGSAYHTDGLRAVMFFVTRPRALPDIQRLDWVPELERREARAAAEQPDTPR